MQPKNARTKTKVFLDSNGWISLEQLRKLENVKPLGHSKAAKNMTNFAHFPRPGESGPYETKDTFCFREINATKPFRESIVRNCHFMYELISKIWKSVGSHEQTRLFQTLWNMITGGNNDNQKFLLSQDRRIWKNLN